MGLDKKDKRGKRPKNPWKETWEIDCACVRPNKKPRLVGAGLRLLGVWRSATA